MLDDSQVKTRMESVRRRCEQFWSGEAEVAATFFSKPRTKDEHLTWLMPQCVRELGAGTNFGPVGEKIKSIEVASDRHEIWRDIQKLEEEFSHYVVLADIVEELAGRKVSPEELRATHNQPEHIKERGVRRRDEPWARAASSFNEGGGLGIYYAAMNLKPMAGDPYREKIAAAMGMIYDDELLHGLSGTLKCEEYARKAEDEAWDQLANHAVAVSQVRVRMRNEQFGHPLSEDRLVEIDEGIDIEPYRFDMGVIDVLIKKLGIRPNVI